MAQALMIAGPLLMMAGSISGGMAANKAAKFEAAQIERQAKAAQAEASREAMEEGRQRDLALSRAQAIGAASGAGRASRIEGEIAAEGTYRALSAVWAGDERAAGLNTQAQARRIEGKNAKRASFFRAASAGASGLGNFAASPSGMSLLEKYG